MPGRDRGCIAQNDPCLPGVWKRDSRRKFTHRADARRGSECRSNVVNRWKIPAASCRESPKCKEAILIVIRSLTPQQAAGNALAVHFQYLMDFCEVINTWRKPGPTCRFPSLSSTSYTHHGSKTAPTPAHNPYAHPSCTAHSAFCCTSDIQGSQDTFPSEQMSSAERSLFSNHPRSLAMRLQNTAQWHG